MPLHAPPTQPNLKLTEYLDSPLPDLDIVRGHPPLFIPLAGQPPLIVGLLDDDQHVAGLEGQHIPAALRLVGVEADGMHHRGRCGKDRQE